MVDTSVRAAAPIKKASHWEYTFSEMRILCPMTSQIAVNPSSHAVPSKLDRAIAMGVPIQIKVKTTDVMHRAVVQNRPKIRPRAGAFATLIDMFSTRPGKSPTRNTPIAEQVMKNKMRFFISAPAPMAMLSMSGVI